MYRVYCGDVLIHDGSSPDKSIHVISPKLQIADSVAGSFTFTLPTSNRAYDIIELFTSTIIIEKDNDKIWIGRPISKKFDFYNQIQYTCEGALAFLNDSIQEPCDLMHYDPAIFIMRCLTAHNQKVDASRRIYPGLINAEDPDDSYVYETEYITTWEAIKKNCLDRIKGHMRIRYRNSDLRMFLDYTYGYIINDNEQEINFGNNLLTFTRDFNITDVVTVVIPFGKQLETESEENSEEDTSNNDSSNNSNESNESSETSSSETIERKREYLNVSSVNDGSIYVIDQNTIGTYGRVEKVIQFSDVDDPNDLLRLANEYLTTLQFSSMNLEIKAIDMHYLINSEPSFELLDLVHCISAPHDLDGWYPINKIDIALDSPDNTVYYLGYRDDSHSSMTGKSSASMSGMAQEIAAAEKSAVVKTEVLLADYAHITEGVIDNATINHADVNDLEANYAHIVDGVIDNAKIDHADVNNLEANYAHISAGLIDNAYIGYERVQDLSAHYAHIQNGIIDNAKIDQADINNLQANYAHLVNGVIDNAQIGYADVIDLDANYAHVFNGVIDNATIGYADVNDLAAHYALIDISNVQNSWINRGVIRDASISDAMIADVSANKLTAGEINAGVIRVYNLNASNITVGTINGQLVDEGTLSLDKLNEQVYTAEEIEAIVDVLNSRIDGAINTYTGTAVPTLINYPASDWTTDTLKDSHVGDVYYVIDSGSEYDGYNYRFSKINGVYSWQLIRDTAISDALARITTAENNIVAIQQFDNNIQMWSTNTESSLGNLIASYNNLVTTTNKSLVSSTQVWINTDSETPPAKPEQPVLNGQYLTDSLGRNILDSDSEPIQTQYWYIVIPPYDDTRPYYYYCYEYQYLDGTYGWSNVVYDRGLSETYRNNFAGIEATIQLWTVRDDDSYPEKPFDTSKTGAGTYYEFLDDSTYHDIVDSSGRLIATRTKWDVFIPIYNPGMPYYFYCYEYQYVDGTYGWSEPVLDTATSELQSKTDLVMTELETRVTSNIFNELVHDVAENSATITTITEITETALDQSVEYIVGTQTGPTGAWTGITRDVEIKVGKSIAYKLPYAGSGNATLKLTLSDGTLSEAIPIYINNSRVTTQFEANSVINLTYDGTNWRATGYWTEDTYNRTRYESNITAANAINSGRIICGTNSGYKNIGSGVSFNLSHPLLYSREAITQGSTGNNNDLMASNINYSSNGSIQNGSKDKVIYLKGTVAGNTFTIAASNYLTTVVPTAADNYYYIPLGVMSSATHGSFSSTNQLMAYVGDSFQQTNITTVTTSNTVNEVKQTADTNSATIRNLTTRMGTNADGTAGQQDIVTRYSELYQDLENYKTTVGNTYYTKTEAERITERLDSAETSIGQTADAIALKADKSSVYTKQETEQLVSVEATNRNAAIQVAANGIFATVDATYITKTEFNNLYIDGRNILKYTKSFTGIDLIDSKGSPILDSNGASIGKYMDGSLDLAESNISSTPNESDFYVRELDNTSASSSTYKEFARYKNVTAPKLRKTYYFSFWAKGSGHLTAYFYPTQSGETIVAVTSQNATRTSADGMIEITLSNTWTRYWIKWSLSDTSTESQQVRNVLLRLFGGNKASVYGLKFEQNNLVSDWSAAPEDYDLYLLDVKDLYERVEQNQHQIEVTEKTFLSRITESVTINQKYVDEVISTEIVNRSSEISQTSTDILARVSADYTSKGEFNGMQIGGRNYLLNTQEFTGNGYLDSNGQDINDSTNNIVGSSEDRYYDGGQSILQELKYRDLAIRYLDNTSSPSSTYKDFAKFNNVMIPKVGEYYCLGFYAKGSGSIQVIFGSGSNSAKFNILTCQEVEINDSYNGQANVQLNGEWNKYWVRWFCTETPSEVNRYILLRLYGGNKAYVCGMKFEIGSKATDWTAAPEDGDNYTENYMRKIGDAIVESTEAYIKLTSDNIMSVVSAKTDKGEIISMINQSPEKIAIDANRITLNGNVEFTNLHRHVYEDIDEAIDDINSGKADIMSTVTDYQYIYKSATSGTNSMAAPTGWITNNTGNQNVWTNVRPVYNSDYPVLFVAKQTMFADGTITCSTPKKDQTTTVIDGGHITTGTIDAARIAVNQIEVGSLKDGDEYSKSDVVVADSQIIYYAKLANTGAPSRRTTWVTDETGNVNRWTLKRPNVTDTYTVYIAQLVKHADDSISCSNPIVDIINITYASKADSANKSQIIYRSYSSNYGQIISDTSMIPSTWITDETGNQNVWTTYRPQYSTYYPYLYTAIQTLYNDNFVITTNPKRDETTTIIDGGHIITGSVTSTQLDTEHIYVTDFQGINRYAKREDTITDVQYIYYRSTYSYTPSLPSYWINSSSAYTGEWTKYVFPLSNNYYLYQAVQTLYDDGDVNTVMLGLNEINNAIKNIESMSEVQPIYLRASSGTSSSSIYNYYMPSGWVTNDSTNPSSYTWTTARPQYSSSYPVTFMATQMKMSDGSVTTSYPSKDETTTVIDGGHITTGTIDASRVTVDNLDASNIVSGYISADRISGGSINARYIDVYNLDASNITTGSLSADRISGGSINARNIDVYNLDASNITTGYLNANRISGGSIDARDVYIYNLDADNITTGHFSADRIRGGNIEGINGIAATGGIGGSSCEFGCFGADNNTVRITGDIRVYYNGSWYWTVDDTWFYGQDFNLHVVRGLIV